MTEPECTDAEWSEPGGSVVVDGRLTAGGRWELLAPPGLRPSTEGSGEKVNDLEIIPTLWGTTEDGDKVTLLDSTHIPAFDRGFLGGKDSFQPQAIVTGHHLPVGGLVDDFHLITEHLGTWSGRAALAPSVGSDDITIPTSLDTVFEVQVPGATISLITGVDWTINGGRATFDRVTQWRVHLTEPQPWNVALDEYAHPLADLVSFGAGVYSKISDLKIRPVGQEQLHPMRKRWFDDSAEVAAPIAHEMMFTLPMWTGDPTDLVTRWFSELDRFDHPVTALLARDRQPMNYVEDRLITAGGLIETLLPALGVDGKAQATPEREAQIARVVDALGRTGLNEHDLAFARKALRGRNDKTFREKFVAVAERAGQVGKQVLESQAELGGNLANLRGGPAHGKSTKLGSEGHWAADAARWIAYAAIMLELGFDPAQVDNRLTRHSTFRRCLLGLRTGD